MTINEAWEVLRKEYNCRTMTGDNYCKCGHNCDPGICKNYADDEDVTDALKTVLDAFNCSELPNSSDCISRQAAIDVLHGYFDGMLETDTWSPRDVYGLIEVLPSAQPERKKGEWIPAFDGKFTGGAYWFSCSKCKRIVLEVRNGGWNFCPNCGADMREVTT